MIHFLVWLLALALSACTLAPEEATPVPAPAVEASPAPAPTFDPPPAPFANGQVCTVEPDILHAPAGACFVVTADEWSTLGTCEGTIAQNYVGKTWELDCPGCG